MIKLAKMGLRECSLFMVSGGGHFTSPSQYLHDPPPATAKLPSPLPQEKNKNFSDPPPPRPNHK